jgi:8-oxo-dGTP pyrophosphatase MutT (NUDIX family)
VISKDTAPEDQRWETILSKTEFANRHLTVAIEQVRTPTRPSGRPWTIVHRKAAVVIAPMTQSGNLVLIYQERIPIRAAIWEVPAGQIDGPPTSDAIIETARRELREETGYDLAPEGELVSLGDYFSSPGFTDERGYFFLARPVERNANGPAHDDGESILGCKEFSAAEIARMISAGEIRDANTLSIYARLASRGLLDLNTPSVEST